MSNTINLEKYIHLVLIDKEGFITNNADLNPVNLDSAIVLAEAYYQLKDNYTGKSYEDRFLILAKLLNLKTEILFWEFSSSIRDELRETKLNKFEYMFNYLSNEISKMQEFAVRALLNRI